MPTFSRRSKEALETCHPDLQLVANKAIEIVDFSVLCGFRNKDQQNHAFLSGSSKVQWPNSKHNQFPSLAMDLCPYPVDWNSEKAFRDLAIIILTVSRHIGIDLEWGGEWKEFPDFPHYQLKES